MKSAKAILLVSFLLFCGIANVQPNAEARHSLPFTFDSVVPTPTPTPSPVARRLYLPVIFHAAARPALPRIFSISPSAVDEVITISAGSASPLDMTGWSIQSADGTQLPECPYLSEQLFKFPEGYILAPGAAVRIHSGPDARDNLPADLLWSTTRMWSYYGDRAQLLDANGSTIDTYRYGLCQ